VSLRGRLLVLLLALVVVGLVVADVATYAALKRFLVQRIDQQLEATWRPVELAVQLPDRFPNAADGPGGRAGVDVQLRNPAGVVIGTYRSRRSTETSKPQIPKVLPRSGTDPLPRAAAGFGLPANPASAAGSGGGGSATAPPEPTAVPAPHGNAVLRTVGSVGSGPPWRLRISTLSNGDTLVIALPMRDVADTLHDLRWIELAVTAAVLLAAAGVGFLVVRLGLRPLDDIEETAEHIAAGDLTRRVPEAAPRTEVGRLGIALNAMLSQIEGAFAERQESENRLRQFVADASHELRTPLTSIRGYAELFRRGADHRPEDLAKTMRRIEEEAIRMGVLVDDLLLLARLDSNRPLDDAPVNLADVVHQAVDAARVIDDQHPITLEAAGPVWVLGDRVRLRQVVDNLLANVRTHTATGTSAAVRLTTGSGEAVIEVDDRGAGLAPAEAARVFERFFRADPSRTRDRGGSGLGLSIVHSIVTAHGGTAAVTSAPGMGSCFRITLPLQLDLTAGDDLVDVAAGEDHGTGNGSTGAALAGGADEGGACEPSVAVMSRGSG
jgi:two-component system OmpR family sensor kinase